MHLVLTGASGMVGSAALAAMLRDPAVTRVTVVARRRDGVAQASATPEACAKCRVVEHADFSQPPPKSLLLEMADAHGVVWALGVSQTQVDRAAYERITVEYPLVFCRALMGLDDSTTLGEAADKTTATTAMTATATTTTSHENVGGALPPPINFVLVSAEGATVTPGRFTATYEAVKGRAETALLALVDAQNSSTSQHHHRRLNVYYARPGAVDPTGHTEIAEYARARMTGLKGLYSPPVWAVLRCVYPPIISPTANLGAALLQLVRGDGRPFASADDAAATAQAGTGAGALAGPLPGIVGYGGGRILSNVALRKLGEQQQQQAA